MTPPIGSGARMPDPADDGVYYTPGHIADFASGTGSLSVGNPPFSAPTMRADLLSDEYRAPCTACDGRVTIHRIQQTSYGWAGVCTEHQAADGAEAERGA